MKKTLMNIGMVVAMAVGLLATAVTASAQGKHGGNGNGHGNQTSHQRDWRANTTHDNRDFGLGHKKNAHGYRNYGQYRRTQVGNRGSLWARRRHAGYRTLLGRRIRRNH